MPLLNGTRDVRLGADPVDEMFTGGVLVWSRVEKWSPWMNVLTADPGVGNVGAWFSRVANYNNGFAPVRWRYSNHGRVQYCGLMTATSSIMTFEQSILLARLPDDPLLPKPTNQRNQFGDGVLNTPGNMVMSDIGGIGYRIEALGIYHHAIAPWFMGKVQSISPGAWLSINATFSLVG